MKRPNQPGQTAVDKFYLNYAGKLIAFARRIVKDKGLAAGIVNEALANNIDLLNTTDPKEAMPILFTIIRHDCIDFLRTEKAMGRTHRKYDQQMSRDLEPTEEQLIIKAEYFQLLSQRLSDAIAQLTPKERAAIDAWKNNYGNAKEIAQYLGITESTFRKNLSRAKKKLKKALGVKTSRILLLISLLLGNDWKN